MDFEVLTADELARFQTLLAALEDLGPTEVDIDPTEACFVLPHSPDRFVTVSMLADFDGHFSVSLFVDEVCENFGDVSGDISDPAVMEAELRRNWARIDALIAEAADYPH